MDINEQLRQVCQAFRITDTYLGYDAIRIGNVNKTYKVNFQQADGSQKSYLVQNVNTFAFRDPVGLMNNIDKVTEHIRKKAPGEICLHYHHTAQRKTYLAEGDNFWRMANYIPSVTYDSVKDLNIVEAAGVAFGRFQAQLSDFDIASLHETIPDFHNTRRRFEALKMAAAEDKAGRAQEAAGEIRFLLENEDLACTLTDLQRKGQLPLRVTHNDTKINNVLFDPATGKALVVVDLDTVMPGLMGADYGDAIRSAANLCEEDCPDPSKAGVNMAVFEAFTKGFLSKTAASITQTEADTLAISCYCLAMELSARFLTDYLEGDPYFTIRYPDHNLVRTRCQLAMAKALREKQKEMEAIIARCLAECK